MRKELDQPHHYHQRHEHLEHAEELFTAQEAQIKRLQTDPQTFFEEIPNIDRAFESGDGCVRCIDERTPGGYHAAGSFIAMSLDEIKRYVLKAGVKGIYSHEGCGAAALAYMSDSETDKSLDERTDEEGKSAFAEQVNAYAIRKAEEIVAKLEQAGINIEYKGHLTSEKMSGNKDLHTARVIYYVGTMHFDPSRLEGELPLGFMISREYLHEAYAVKEVELATLIARGEHGFGKLFTAEKPLLVVVLAPKSDLEVADRLKSEVIHLEAKYEQSVKVLTVTI